MEHERLGCGGNARLVGLINQSACSLCFSITRITRILQLPLQSFLFHKTRSLFNLDKSQIYSIKKILTLTGKVPLELQCLVPDVKGSLSHYFTRHPSSGSSLASWSRQSAAGGLCRAPALMGGGERRMLQYLGVRTTDGSTPIHPPPWPLDSENKIQPTHCKACSAWVGLV